MDSVSKRNAWRQVEGDRRRRKHSIVRDGERPDSGRFESRERRQRHHLAGERRAQVEVLQAVYAAALALIRFEDEAVLVHFVLVFADLPLSVRVVENLIDVFGPEAEASRGDTIDVELRDSGAKLHFV